MWEHEIGDLGVNAWIFIVLGDFQDPVLRAFLVGPNWVFFFARLLPGDFFNDVLVRILACVACKINIW